jgi:hypothetical protein
MTSIESTTSIASTTFSSCTASFIFSNYQRMSIANWLIYIQINKNEGKHTKKCMDEIQRNMNHGITAYVMHFGPTMQSDAFLCKYTKHTSTVLLRYKNKRIDDVSINAALFSKYLSTNNIQIDGVCIWSHGAGYGLGKWRKWKHAVLPIKQAVKYLISPFDAKLVIFDACFQGSMSCLYEMPPHVEIVIAPPAFHPFTSLMWTKGFGRLKRNMSKRELQCYAHEIVCEWNKLTKYPWKCVLVFDMGHVRVVASMVKKVYPMLKFDRISQIDNDDANLHDLFAAARHFPEVQIMILKSISTSANCSKCMLQCCKRVRGMSIEARLPRKWLDAYMSSRWYNEILTF